MPLTYYQAVEGVLESGAVFKLYYPTIYIVLVVVFRVNCSIVTKGGTSHFNLSTQSLDMVISTFQVQDRGAQQAPILGLWGCKWCWFTSWQ